MHDYRRIGFLGFFFSHLGGNSLGLRIDGTETEG